ncbi:MAG TPA: hypothetical protein ENJ00_06875 [Phycisphaerales bacterium]|nr:hypothetical protein [Phycisphaerales bacterium]
MSEHPPQPPHSPQPPQPASIQAAVVQPTNTLGIVGFILSLLGFVGTCGLLSPIGLILSIIALRREPKGFAIAGLILGILGTIVFALAMLIFGVFALAFVGLLAAGITLSVPNLTTYSEIIQIEAAVEQYAKNNGGALPDSLTTAIGSNTELATDYWDQPYVYESLDSGQFRITSLGADGIAGTEDDITFTYDLK